MQTYMYTHSDISHRLNFSKQLFGFFPSPFLIVNSTPTEINIQLFMDSFQALKYSDIT